jgi:hypothetical protein
MPLLSQPSARSVVLMKDRRLYRMNYMEVNNTKDIGLVGTIEA